MIYIRNIYGTKHSLPATETIAVLNYWIILNNFFRLRIIRSITKPKNAKKKPDPNEF
jgi:hypothetical protein